MASRLFERFKLENIWHRSTLRKEGTHMAWALLEMDVYIRFADEPAAFVCTVKYGGFTLKSERIPTSRRDSQTADVDGRSTDVSTTVEHLLRKRNDG